ncbi:MAG: pyridoxal 5'-phosphate synthase glutaminase subunit PdxT, partial [Candidatus Eisenbacteria bacterium]|nr:pyridoxal 5'-phosphate synthase glutaminase subunit PdxT [Candidatus Eisenbacteria bacterium]
MTAPRAKRRHEAPRVGLLSLQGDFERHRDALESLGAEAVRVSLPEHKQARDA